jgi:uncharacterized membrane protein HdeD (DUF308 family)
MKRFVMAIGVILAILGLVALVHPSFDYHKHEEVAKIGPITATVDKPERTTVPPIVAGVLLVAGAVLIVLSPRIKQ